jgi:hypothetical protein
MAGATYSRNVTVRRDLLGPSFVLNLLSAHFLGTMPLPNPLLVVLISSIDVRHIFVVDLSSLSKKDDTASPTVISGDSVIPKAV